MLKKPLTYKEQIDKLKEHGMHIQDEKYAETIISQINYYRFTGYALQFRKAPNDSSYVVGTNFNEVLSIYRFDEELRSVLRKYLEFLEVYFRTVISHEFSLAKCMDSPHTQHYSKDNYYNKIGFESIINHFKQEKAYYRDSLIMKHHQKKYNGEMPLWVMVEMMSLSDVSKLYSCMYNSEQLRIANVVGCSKNTLKNNLHCISVLRNKCAHAARIYNTTFNPPVSFSTSFLRKYKQMKTDTLFAYIIVLIKRLPEKCQREDLIRDLEKLLDTYDDTISLSEIGFPTDWCKVLKNQIHSE